jgi:hypothetical protein
METPLFASLNHQIFHIWLVNAEVCQILPHNTPIHVKHVRAEDTLLGMEWEIPFCNPLNYRWELSQWMEEKGTTVSYQFSYPGNCKWTFDQGQLSIHCSHESTLLYWAKRILNFYGFEAQTVINDLVASNEMCQLILPNKAQAYNANFD